MINARKVSSAIQLRRCKKVRVSHASLRWSKEGSVYIAHSLALCTKQTGTLRQKIRLQLSYTAM